LALGEESASPLFLRIARGVTDDVRRGRLRAGDPLPGSRALAESLGVNRNTVVAAYRELVAEGWAEARPGGGTFVAEGLPERRPRALTRTSRSSLAQTPGFTLRAESGPFGRPWVTYPRGTLVMAGGVPDVRMAPAQLIARAYRRVLASRSGVEALGYGDPRGDARLRAAVAELVREARGVPASADDVIVTRGSQMGLELVARAVVPNGGCVAVESIGYPPAWGAFARAGARIVPVPVDARGIDVEALAELTRRERVHAVYVTPHHHYPTTVTLSPARRLALLELAHRVRFAIVEDDYDHELHYEGRPILPLASADAHGSVVYVGTLSKVVAPGLRLGYVVAPPPVVERLSRDRLVVDRQGDHVTERAAAELIEDGTVARHVRRARRVYAARRDLLLEELERAFGDRVEAKVPSGGMAIWARVRLPPSGVGRWERRALGEGVAFAAGERFALDGVAISFARFGFAMLDEDELREAVKRLARAFPGPAGP
jgi:GntR family transcriptional regulator / MocR family aminotransferase